MSPLLSIPIIVAAPTPASPPRRPSKKWSDSAIARRPANSAVTLLLFLHSTLFRLSSSSASLVDVADVVEQYLAPVTGGVIGVVVDAAEDANHGRRHLLLLPE